MKVTQIFEDSSCSDNSNSEFREEVLANLSLLLDRQAQQTELIEEIISQGEDTMADIVNLTSDVNALTGAVATTVDVVNNLEAQVATLTAGQVSQADIDALDASVQAAKAALEGAVDAPEAPVDDTPAPPVDENPVPVDDAPPAEGDAPVDEAPVEDAPVDGGAGSPVDGGDDGSSPSA